MTKKVTVSTATQFSCWDKYEKSPLLKRERFGKSWRWCCVRCKLQSLRSEHFNVNVGLPGGFALSSLLFIFFVTSMFDGMKCDKFKLADDRYLLNKASNPTQLKIDTPMILNKLNRWSEKWKTKINGEKKWSYKLREIRHSYSDTQWQICAMSFSAKIPGIIVYRNLNIK